MINVLLVEDHELYRMGLSMLLEKADWCAQKDCNNNCQERLNVMLLLISVSSMFPFKS